MLITQCNELATLSITVFRFHSQVWLYTSLTQTMSDSNYVWLRLRLTQTMFDPLISSVRWLERRTLESWKICWLARSWEMFSLKGAESPMLFHQFPFSKHLLSPPFYVLYFQAFISSSLLRIKPLFLNHVTMSTLYNVASTSSVRWASRKLRSRRNYYESDHHTCDHF